MIIFRVLRYCAWVPIKPKPISLVKQCATLVFLAVSCALAGADTPRQKPDSVPETRIPDIETRTFRLTVVKRSKSGKIYLFEDTEEAKPRVGKIILLKRESQPVMAFRILKTYPDKKQFAAKQIRVYGDNHVLADGEFFTSLEKMADLPLPPLQPPAPDSSTAPESPTATEPYEAAQTHEESTTSEAPKTIEESKTSSETFESPKAPAETAATSASDNASLSELDDLDGSETAQKPQPPGPESPETYASTEEGEQTEDEEAIRELEMQETTPLEPNDHSVSAGFGMLKNFNTAGGSGSFTAGGVRYAWMSKRMTYFDQAGIQDSISLEGGLFMYKIINSDNFDPQGEQGDAYAVLSLLGTLRYNIHLGETMGIFAYGGIMQNIVTSASSPTSGAKAQEIASALSATLPAIGVGLFFRLAPNWDVRVDLGYEMQGMGLVLKF